ncbi:MAG: hypothetical protein ACRD1K_20605 [Acidimicrobiales bacterium]
MDPKTSRSIQAALILSLIIQAFMLGLVMELVPPAEVRAAQAFAVEDVNRDGLVDVLDVQLVVNRYLEGADR